MLKNFALLGVGLADSSGEVGLRIFCRCYLYVDRSVAIVSMLDSNVQVSFGSRVVCTSTFSATLLPIIWFSDCVTALGTDFLPLCLPLFFL